MFLIAVVSALLYLAGANGAPIAGASVTFIDSARHSVQVSSDAGGAARAPADFDAVRARVQAKGFEPADAAIVAPVQHLTLEPLLPVVASVNVATGSPQTLHALPVAAAALDRETIALSSAPATDALLRTLPGFDPQRSNSAFTNYGQLRASFSGAGNDRGLVLVDGIPAQDGFGGQVDWLAYPSSDLTFAELLRGAGSALYGTGAIGGVLDLHTYRPQFGASGSQIAGGLNAGTDSYGQEWLNARSNEGGRFAASIALQQQRASYFDLPPGYSSPIDTAAVARSGAADLQTAYAFSPNDVIEAGERIASDAQDEGRPNYSMGRRFNQFDTHFTHTGQHSSITAIAYERNAYIVNIADLFPAKPGILRYLQDVPTTESGAIAQWTVDSPASTFGMRADGRWIRGATYQYSGSGTVQSSVFGRQNLGGLSLQETMRSRRWETILGGRVDRVFAPRAAVRYALTHQWNLRASAGTGFRLPYLNELLRSYVIAGVTYAANPNLSPERSWTASAGADWSSGRYRFSADLLHTVVNDAIMFRTISSTQELRSNIPQAQTDGLSATFTDALTAQSRLSFFATQQLARVTQGPSAILGDQLQYVPRSSASLAYETLAGRVRAGADLSYIGQTYADDLNTEPLGTALVGDVRFLVPFSSALSFSVSGSNIFSARYRSSVDRWAMPSLFSIGIQTNP